MTKLISIIGSGKVGSAIAFLTASNSLDDVVLINRSKNKAVGEAMDISNAISGDSEFSVTGTDDFSAVNNSEIIIIAASAGTYSQNRMEIVTDQIKMTRYIIKALQGASPESKVLIVSNPVDVLTYVIQKEGHFSSDKILGVASSLDSSRFRFLLSEELSVTQSQIRDAMVLGEHGDTMVPIFSQAKKINTPVSELLKKDQMDAITGNLKFYWRILREYKSRSVFGISRQVYDVINAITKNNKITIPCSVMLDGEYGISDVCLGIPAKISKNGLDEILKVEITDYEMQQLHQSAESIKHHIRNVV